MTTTAIAPAGIGHFTAEQKSLIKSQVMVNWKGEQASDGEVDLFLSVCASRGLCPFRKQIYAVARQVNGKTVWAYQVSIEGLLGRAERTKERDGFDGPYWCGDDGIWTDIWLSDKAPAAAKMTAFRKGHSRPYTCVAQMSFYQQTNRDGIVKMWKKGGGAHMLGKCALALSLRLAFPEECGGLYAPEEMLQADLGIPASAIDAAIDVEPVPSEYDGLGTPELLALIAKASDTDLDNTDLKNAIRNGERQVLGEAWRVRKQWHAMPDGEQKALASPAELECNMCSGPIASGTRCSGCDSTDEVTS